MHHIDYPHFVHHHDDAFIIEAIEAVTDITNKNGKNILFINRKNRDFSVNLRNCGVLFPIDLFDRTINRCHNKHNVL